LNGTWGYSINDAGAVAGSAKFNSPRYSSPYWSFVRNPFGAIDPFSAPGAGSSSSEGTQAFGINNAGAVTGYYVDPQGVTHGFVRTPRGVFIRVDAPGATEAHTFAVGINDAGAVTGYFNIDAGLMHSFVRSSSGVFLAFDAPGAGGSAYSGTFAGSINDAGAVTGYYIDAYSTYHGFLRTP
jgi:hypothetical protein